MPEKLLNSQELAEMLGLGIDTIKHWRINGAGPGYIKVGRSVRYRQQEIEAWLKENEVTTWTK